MSHDDAVPVSAGDLGSEHLTTVLRQVFFAGHQQFRVRIELHEFTSELFQQMIRDNIHGLADQTACFIFMPVAAIVKVLPAPTTWASSVLPELMPRQTASF